MLPEKRDLFRIGNYIISGFSMYEGYPTIQHVPIIISSHCSAVRRTGGSGPSLGMK
jgi:hypothetical protein